MSTSTATRPPLLLLLQLPLIVASWLCHRLARILVDFVAPRLQASNRTTAGLWRVYSPELFARPGVFPILLVKGPRWNPHAILAMAGPFRVEHTLTVELGPVYASAESWSLVLYRYPGAATVDHIGSATLPVAREQHTWHLPPGDYVASLRYYGWGEAPALPTVSADDLPVVAPCPVDPTTNRVYDQLRARRSRLGQCLHFYVYPMLRLAPWLPRRWVEAALLPVGNPETTFYYGPLAPGERLRLHAPTTLVADYAIYACIYTWDSLPRVWARMTTADLALPPDQERGFYVIRVHPLRAGLASPDGLRITAD